MIHVRVPREYGQETVNKLKNLKLIDNNYKISSDSNYVYIPVTKNPHGYETVERDAMPSSRIEPEKVSFSYDIIGSIAIIKGKSHEEAMYLARFLITRKNIKTVYLDTGINGEFRTRNLTLLYGDPVYRTLYQENGIRMNVDVSRAYFSPRLASERLRIAKEVMDGETIVDMFAGIGPFSLLIAKNRKCKIIAIDKNPDAIELLNENIKLNRITGNIEAITGDSGTVVSEYSGIDRVIMNLPHDSIRFLSIAAGATAPGGLINYYEICDLDTLESRMEEFREMGLEIIYKRIVHGFSKYQNMYSIELKKSGK
jgi:tRNA (guanine37-N1)-methyltransferase